MAQNPKAEDTAPGRRKAKNRTVALRIKSAQEQFEELTGADVESVSGVNREEKGWVVTVETVELRRVPDTVSLLATYRLELDADGALTGYRREKRYVRGRADEHQ
ncbi:gas vesicle protein GvpO [Nocardiopsis lambiniae]|uniref:Gas vesicle protein n=1 Tax=Nocardiopsis lambiniae TaxID=3075539 RepID=A0ABU2M6P5_9ACTN|nr:gas vesicle protein [Nocardiopsis sp. DSM 44743]MDT0328312.1 gas vesicle protein [Nocardiopsis sp. DSM 44743]